MPSDRGETVFFHPSVVSMPPYKTMRGALITGTSGGQGTCQDASTHNSIVRPTASGREGELLMKIEGEIKSRNPNLEVGTLRGGYDSAFVTFDSCVTERTNDQFGRSKLSD